MGNQLDNIYTKLMYIQGKLIAPKDSQNQHSKYFYRSAEDILDNLKPLLEEKECIIILNDNLVGIDGSMYIESEAKLVSLTGETISTKAYAKEPQSLAGMSAGQITGATSSYARKYALCGLFGISDRKDDLDNDLSNNNSNSGSSNKTQSRNKSTSNSSSTNEVKENLITDGQVKYIATLVKGSKTKIEVDNLLKNRYKVDAVSNLTKLQAMEFIDYLKTLN